MFALLTLSTTSSFPAELRDLLLTKEKVKEARIVTGPHFQVFAILEVANVEEARQWMVSFTNPMPEGVEHAYMGFDVDDLATGIPAAQQQEVHPQLLRLAKSWPKEAGSTAKFCRTVLGLNIRAANALARRNLTPTQILTITYDELKALKDVGVVTASWVIKARGEWQPR